jgi:hypothetical protein
MSGKSADYLPTQSTYLPTTVGRTCRFTISISKLVGNVTRTNLEWSLPIWTRHTWMLLLRHNKCGANYLKNGKTPTTHSFEIADADGKTLLTLPFKEVLEAGRKPIVPCQLINQSVHLIDKAKTLIEALIDQIQDTRTVIEITRKTVRRSSQQKYF